VAAYGLAIVALPLVADDGEPGLIKLVKRPYVSSAAMLHQLENEQVGTASFDDGVFILGG
jgi:hypothetical protein